MRICPPTAIRISATIRLQHSQCNTIFDLAIHTTIHSLILSSICSINSPFIRPLIRCIINEPLSFSVCSFHCITFLFEWAPHTAPRFLSSSLALLFSLQQQYSSRFSFRLQILTFFTLLVRNTNFRHTLRAPSPRQFLLYAACWPHAMLMSHNSQMKEDMYMYEYVPHAACHMHKTTFPISNQILFANCMWMRMQTKAEKQQTMQANQPNAGQKKSASKTT